LFIIIIITNVLI